MGAIINFNKSMHFLRSWCLDPSFCGDNFASWLNNYMADRWCSVRSSCFTLKKGSGGLGESQHAAGITKKFHEGLDHRTEACCRFQMELPPALKEIPLLRNHFAEIVTLFFLACWVFQSMLMQLGVWYFLVASFLGFFGGLLLLPIAVVGLWIYSKKRLQKKAR